jgi:hypothetical protein
MGWQWKWCHWKRSLYIEVSDVLCYKLIPVIYITFISFLQVTTFKDVLPKGLSSCLRHPQWGWSVGENTLLPSYLTGCHLIDWWSAKLNGDTILWDENPLAKTFLCILWITVKSVIKIFPWCFKNNIKKPKSIQSMEVFGWKFLLYDDVINKVYSTVITPKLKTPSMPCIPCLEYRKQHSVDSLNAVCYD